MKRHAVRPYALRIEKLFRFEDGTIVFAGPVEGGGSVLAPCASTLMINGEARSVVHLAGERMPGNLPGSYRVVFTHDEVDLDPGTIRKAVCEIVCPGAGEHATTSSREAARTLRAENDALR